ncbi:alpha-amylase family glycosyl hydrolase [uncultured Amnibacterium sp.]|uniref:alpha-amylase family glycosyl hydrolase n=1 Tax=uncultured Amnibacterium sp. TaxID=1631851 RepID=UPI0035CB8F52
MRFEHEIIWHAYPLGFVGAERENPIGAAVQHRLPRLERWLDHLVELGANALQLGPVFDSETHGYDTRDHLRIDPRLGDEDDLRALIAAAHERGIKVVLDGVFNHVGRSFPRFVAAEAGDPEAAAWFRRDGDGWADFEGHASLVVLNHDSPAVRAYVIEVMRHWLDLGVDGWRLDAAYAVPTDFWRAVSDAVHASHPHAWLLAEVIHGDYAAFVAESGLDSVTQYELWKAVWSSLNDANPFELAWTLGRHRDLVASFLPTVFVGNHDTTRIASALTDERHLPHAVTALLTAGGIPAIYAGDEEGFTGVKEDRAGGDDAVRPPFPEDPSGLSPLGEPVLRLHQRLISLRRRKPWLVDGVYEQVRLDDAALVYRMTARDGRDAIMVALNMSDRPIEVPLGDGERILEGGLGAHEAAVIGRD